MASANGRKSTRSALTAMLAPRALALIGATDSPGSVGRALLENLRSFSGEFHPARNDARRIVEAVRAVGRTLPNFVSACAISSGRVTACVVFQDRALDLPSLNGTLARRMKEQTRIYHALQGFRERAAVDLAALKETLIRFSQLVIEQPWIKEIDINPLLASAEQLIALDARVVLHDLPNDASLPQPVIRPYPVEYVEPWRFGGVPVTIRPVRPEDEPLLVKFHAGLSEESVRSRYFAAIRAGRTHAPRTPPPRLLQRLRPRDRARGGAEGSRDRSPRGRAPEQSSRIQ